MSSSEAKSNPIREMIEALQTTRDHARVQAHLFSLDAKKNWQTLEKNLIELQGKLEHGGEKIGTTLLSSFREAMQAAQELMSEVDGSLELETPVEAVMQGAPQTCLPEHSLNQAAQVMWDANCGALPVLSASGTLVGIITDRDICMAAYTRGLPLQNMTIESAMSKTVYTCAPTDSMGHAARTMAEKQVRRLPVVDKGKLVGILSLADLARALQKRKGERTEANAAFSSVVASICEDRPSQARAAAAE